MRQKGVRVFLTVLLLFGLAGLGCAQTRRLTILDTNDTHSAMLPFWRPETPRTGTQASRDRLRPALAAPGLVRGLGLPERGGIARMATLIKRLRAADGNVLALNAGDVFVGSFEFNKFLGYPELKIMENLYDAMALGNHEFDLGLDVLAAVLGGQLAGSSPVSLPVLCANINLEGTYLASMVQPSIVRTVGGITIGIFGLVTQDPQHYSAEVAGRFSPDLYGTAAAQAAGLRQQGCEVVVCLSHLGAMRDIYELSTVPGIDIIIGGHSHDAFEDAVLTNGKIIVQAGAYGCFLGELKVKLENGTVVLESWVLHPVNSSVPEDPEVRAAVNAVRDGVVNDPRFGPVYSQAVATTVREIANTWPATGPNRDTPLGNLVTDAMRSGVLKAGYPVDFALEALGYTALGLPAGKVVGNDILRSVPYGYDPESGLGFKVVVVPLPGEVILGGLEYTTSMIELTRDLCLQASGLRYAYDSSRPAAGFGKMPTRLDLLSVEVGGELVAMTPTKVYMVAMNEQVFNFLNGLLGSQLTAIPTGLFEYNLVRDYIGTLRTVDVRSEGRVRDTVGVVQNEAR
jgi:5'-nucleotidase/UDP-sugar diphosphatase